MKEHSPDPYGVLHLGPAATAREVARAHRALVRAHHPDTRTPGAGPAGPEAGAQELQDIMDAYAVLGDPAKRAAYDRHRRESPPPAPAPAPRAYGPLGVAPHGRSGPALIIGPVRWESHVCVIDYL
ncbi:J domain-containing protein (plasmid) [Pseudarthrobacter sp. P1]|uniref:J domain-containing protein n=1 Tax=Pseudarthrobacter sp. P1 TaxID=3418418 RepID=UPI003CF90F63